MSNAKATFTFRGQGDVELDFPPTKSTRRPVYIFGVKKGGSTLLSKIVRDVSEVSDLTYFELPKICFDGGLPIYRLVEDKNCALERSGYVFGTFRWYPENDILNMDEKAEKILLVRDPRDILVSLYYSDKVSHSIPQSGPLKKSMRSRREELKEVTVDAYAMRESLTILRHYYRTMQLAAIPTVRVFRYRDIVYDKMLLVRQVAKSLGVDPERPELVEIAEKHHKLPYFEKQKSHVRQVHPENYKNKLKQETIDSLNYRFRFIINYFGFDDKVLRGKRNKPASAKSGEQKSAANAPQISMAKAKKVSKPKASKVKSVASAKSQVVEAKKASKPKASKVKSVASTKDRAVKARKVSKPKKVTGESRAVGPKKEPVGSKL